MESDLLEEECPLSPQLHTETRGHGLTRGQRSFQEPRGLPLVYGEHCDPTSALRGISAQKSRGAADLIFSSYTAPL
ncbi:unnamed protein product [Gadus morhua 'NCC']